MIAARLLGRSELGLVAVARDELGVTLTKTNQKDDWSRRPLTPQQEAYALADVTHLVELRERLAARLEAVGRLSWLREECDAVAELEPLARRRDPDAYLAIKGARRLQPRALAALRELHAWRERRAEETDTARPSRSSATRACSSSRSSRPRASRSCAACPACCRGSARQAGEILGAIQRAQALPEAELPVLPRSVRPLVPDAQLRRVERLKAWRTQQGRRAGARRGRGAAAAADRQASRRRPRRTRPRSAGSRACGAGGRAPSAPSSWPPYHRGRLNFGKFEILAELGQGAMGRVYRAHDPILDRYVALKTIAPALLTSKEMLARFRREAERRRG